MKTRTDLLNFIASEIGAKSYLEIGIFDAKNFDSINIEDKLGIDPNVEREDVIKITSDDFFKIEDKKFDLIFIDGDHSHEQSLVDLQNSINQLNEGGVIVMHDAFPTHARLVGKRKGHNSEWCGDVYQTVMWARQQDYLSVITWREDYGCAIITKGTLKAADSVKMDLTYENLHKNPIDSVGLLNTNGVREYFSVYKELSKLDLDIVEEVKGAYTDMTREELKAEYKDKFPGKKIGRKTNDTLIRELTNG